MCVCVCACVLVCLSITDCVMVLLQCYFVLKHNNDTLSFLILHTPFYIERTKTIPSLIKPLVSDSPEKGQKPVPTNEGVELAVPGQKPTVQSGDSPPKPKLPSKDAPIRWGALTVFLAVNVVMMLVLIILIAIE